MKNIHVLKTDKPSRLIFQTNLDKLVLYTRPIDFIKNKLHPQNIYITYDEEIKVGDWMIRGNEQPTKVTPIFFWDFGVRYYKIILTTDLELQKDGVQAIDDEFLEWFVSKANDSGKPIDIVDVEKGYIDWVISNYKIIIPKEELDYSALLKQVGTKQEQKQHLIDMMQDDEKLGLYDKPTLEEVAERLKGKELFKESNDRARKTLSEIKSLPIQETTLEEAAVIYAHKSFVWPLNKQGEKQSIPPKQVVPPGYAKHQKIATKHFIAGAKWQQERMYSEEEVLTMLLDCRSENPIDVNKWFEQFKKK